jgi:hypothetical protein
MFNLSLAETWLLYEGIYINLSPFSVDCPYLSSKILIEGWCTKSGQYVASKCFLAKLHKVLEL